MPSWLSAWWPELASALLSAATLAVAIHAALRKRDVRAAAAWIGLILLVPFAGVLLYWLLGINRVSRAAARLRVGAPSYDYADRVTATADQLELRPTVSHLVGIARALDAATHRPLLGGNRVDVLRDGDEAYPAMLEGIARAKRSVALGSYIFDNDAAGQRFAQALAAAHGAGVQVRVLIDDAGARYSLPSIDRLLRRMGVPVARFLPVWTPRALGFLNLRNHRKLLIVDGALGFTGGMNIRHGCVLAENPRSPTRDLHFRLEGPAVTELMKVFAEDWTFTTHEVLAGETWFPRLERRGDSYARVISDGPDADLDNMRWAFHSALASARHTVQILTPYFLPDEPLITALNVTALRGVRVDIVLPEKSNLRVVEWAMRGELWKVLGHGCRVWLTPPPFDHSKAMVVDSAWCLFGSANWDHRSLRLNFELGVEVYDPGLAQAVSSVIDERMASARRLTREELDRAPRAVRLRDGVARLLSPHL